MQVFNHFFANGNLKIILKVDLGVNYHFKLWRAVTVFWGIDICMSKAKYL